MKEIIQQLFAMDSVWSVILRFGVWFAVMMVIIISMDVTNPKKQKKNLKTNLGLFLLFLVLTSGLMFVLFGVVVI